MEIKIEELEPCKLMVQYTADPEKIKEKRKEVLEVFKNAPVQGFRPGQKASTAAIQIQYRKQIDESVKRALAEGAYHDTIFEKNLRPYGMPQFTNISFVDGKFDCEFYLYIQPKFELSTFREMEVPKPHTNYNATEITEKMLQELRVRFGEVSPYSENDFVQEGDNVILDYEGSINGEKVDTVSATGEMMTVGSSNLKDFNYNLLGMSLGETREFDIVVPESGLPSIAGKTIHFKTTVTMGSKTIPCALDDGLAQKVGKKDFSELRQFVGEIAMGQAANAERVALNEAISHKLVDDNKINVPNWLALSEAQYLVTNSKLEWEKLQDIDREKYLFLAEQNIKLALILDKIRDNEPEAQLTDQEILNIIKGTIASSNQSLNVDDVIKEMSQTGQLQILFAKIRDEYTLDFVSKNIKIVE